MILHCHNYHYNGHSFCVRPTNPRSHIEFHRQHRKESTWTFDLTTFHVWSFCLDSRLSPSDAPPDHQHAVSDVRYGITLGRIKRKIISLGGVVLHLSRFLVDPIQVLISAHRTHKDCTFVHEYCSTVQGLLDWFEVDLGFTELSFIQIDLCVLCVFVLCSRVSLSSCPFLDILHCLPREVGVPL